MMESADGVAALLLLPLAVWILISGLDDLAADAAGLFAAIYWRGHPRPSRRELLRHPQRRIAIFVPCWNESEVITSMIGANRERVLYTTYDFFVGTYPNDERTVDVLGKLERQYNNVHLALCPHDGPTSKADCLNWIYQCMLFFEQANGIHFEIIVTHDAEDVIHTDSLHWINWYSAEYQMVQIPVLPLPTPLTDWTHGVYCDEFSEYQCRDMPARQWMGAFVPSNGVGTGFSRAALDELAAAEGNRIFEPVCLTEDYENGLRLKLRHAKQMFVNVPGMRVATREYFPRTFATAVRQRTRWVTGIALQTWERHGWSGSMADRYWLWRDRKGLVGNPASLLANVIFAWSLFRHQGVLGQRIEELAAVLGVTAALGAYRILFRGWCVGKRFGWKVAAGVPIRVVLANCINTLAGGHALFNYVSARLRGQPLRWVKTAHQYPTAAALQPKHILLGELLVRNGYVPAAHLTEALNTQKPGQKLGERLMELGYLGEEDLYEALSLQTQLPQCSLEPAQVNPQIARSLPRRIVEELRVIPFRIENGQLLLATPTVPRVDSGERLRCFTLLQIRFHLIYPTQYSELVTQLL
ncbi:MAG: glycosyl transferase family protein [Bryobacteraceae bacterium]|nr:glycosyl transferase family protein [Bryobacteraceae bacterium]